jgi:hypothetical protein
MVVDGPSSTLNGRMGAEVEVILKSGIIRYHTSDTRGNLRMGNIFLNQGTRERIVVTITSLAIILLRKETDVVALGANRDSPFDLFDNQ